uniref:Uncharacterized protein n=1 Tax=Oryza glumipatula TaxID=40148 RepID=A0A0E0BM56_9ORYZ
MVESWVYKNFVGPVFLAVISHPVSSRPLGLVPTTTASALSPISDATTIPVPRRATAVPIPNRTAKPNRTSLPFPVPAGSRGDDYSSCRSPGWFPSGPTTAAGTSSVPQSNTSGASSAVSSSEHQPSCSLTSWTRESATIFDDDGDGNDFVEMLLLNSCFILEFLAKAKPRQSRDETTQSRNSGWHI